jgi:hypothetical protein
MRLSLWSKRSLRQAASRSPPYALQAQEVQYLSEKFHLVMR